MRFGQGLPPAGGWKRHMVEDDEYSPAYQDEYRRLWHGAAAERDRLLVFLRNENFEFEDNGQTWRAWPAEDVDSVLARGPGAGE